jgi:alpha-tubulin suppressor-like RCC1 family protein
MAVTRRGPGVRAGVIVLAGSLLSACGDPPLTTTDLSVMTPDMSVDAPDMTVPTDLLVPGDASGPPDLTLPPLPDGGALVSFTRGTALGQGFSCGRSPAGTVRCFGVNGDGQLGDGTFEQRSTTGATVVGLPDAIDVTAGLEFACAVRQGGTAWCWGANNTSQLGRPGFAGVRAELAAPVDGLTGVVGVAAGTTHACALLDDGTTACWGANASGQLGDNNTVARADAQLVAGGLTNVQQIAAGGTSSCALLTNGTVRCWGENGDSQLGIGSTIDQKLPTTMLRMAGSILSGVAEVSLGVAHTCLRLSNGTVMCVGKNNFQQLGPASGTQALPVVVPGISDAKQLALGKDFSCALRQNGEVVCWGLNSEGQLGDDTLVTSGMPVTVAGVSGATEIAAGEAHACVRLAGGGARCWGRDKQGQLGIGSPWEDRGLLAPTADPGLTDVTAVAVGHDNDTTTCAIRADKTLWCWGDGKNGQLLEAALRDRFRPRQMPGVTNVDQVALGAKFVCARSGTAVSCWGLQTGGALGNGMTAAANVTTPSTVMGLPAVNHIDAGDQFACGLATDRTVWCWGQNTGGQLGDNTATSRGNAAQVMGLTDVDWIEVGDDNVCAGKPGGSTWCWGESSDGRLANNTTTPDLRVPTEITTLAGAVQVSLGEAHGCARFAAGNVTCWGNNEFSAVGDGTSIDRLVPVPINITDVNLIVSGDNFNCARKMNGEVWCWGFNGDGQLAIGSVGDRFTPTKSLLVSPDALALGRPHGCARLGMTLRCWGEPDTGQLGNGFAVYQPASVATAF